MDVFGAVVTDTAGNMNAPFAYMWRTDFSAIEYRVMGRSEAQNPDA